MHVGPEVTASIQKKSFKKIPHTGVASEPIHSLDKQQTGVSNYSNSEGPKTYQDHQGGKQTWILSKNHLAPHGP